MEIKRLGENKIRCALSEEEIQNMGFDIDEIISNTETTQRFMRMVVELVEQQENINMENMSPMVKAELLQDHSMAITFGGDSDMSFKSLVDTVGQLMNQLSPEKLDEFKQMNHEEKKSAVDEFFQKYKEKKANEGTKPETAQSPDKEQEGADDIFEESVPFSLEFANLEEAIRLFKVVPFTDRIPQSSLYKFKDKYYLVMDFIHFSKEELRPLAFSIVEYNNNRYAEAAQVAFIKEHGKCIVENEALQTLMQL